ncbi:MAG TPA: aminotransferase class I/II-fold pyridoxal phosphate-dependent enzyme [Rubrivivax sp.]|nr:aminotransferase class I/II-fold pyridoxal phosphate-dependent enzyme [Rubrivivax sp.]
MTAPRMREELLALTPYGSGRPVDAAAPLHRLSSNESPFPPSAAVVEAAGRALREANRYPALVGEPLIEQLAARHRRTTAEIAVASGSVMLIEQLVRAYAGRGDEVLMPWRSYEAYPLIIAGAGAMAVTAPLTPGHGIDSDALLARLTPRTRVLLLCNPNNPSGEALGAAALDALLARVPPTVLVVLDEAYREFVTRTDVPDGAERYRDRPNVAVLRTFSKAYSLAGLRVGYCIAPAALIDGLRRVAPPFPVSAPALAAAGAALGEAGLLAERLAAQWQERAQLCRGLRELGLPVGDPQGNFVWLPVGDRAAEGAAAFLAAGVGVRLFPGEGVRITMGDAVATAAVLGAAAAWCGTSHRTV